MSDFARLKESVLIGCCIEIIFNICVKDVKPLRFTRLIHKNSNFMSQNTRAACLQLAQLLSSCCCMTLVFLMYLVISEMVRCINSTLFSCKSRWFCKRSLVVVLSGSHRSTNDTDFVPCCHIFRVNTRLACSQSSSCFCAQREV